MDVFFLSKHRETFGVQHDSAEPSRSACLTRFWRLKASCAFGLTEGLLLICCSPASHQVDHQPSAIAEPWTLRKNGGLGVTMTSHLGRIKWLSSILKLSYDMVKLALCCTVRYIDSNIDHSFSIDSNLGMENTGHI